MDLAAFCARRERVVRRTLVLVPTAERVPHELFARYAPGEQVELCALADVIEVRAGRIVLREASERGEGETSLPASAPAPAETAEPAPAPALAGGGIAALLGATQWEDIRITFVDGHTVRIEAHGKALLRTFVELGFVDARKTEVVPVKAWALLLVFLQDGGDQAERVCGIREGVRGEQGCGGDWEGAEGGRLGWRCTRFTRTRGEGGGGWRGFGRRGRGRGRRGIGVSSDSRAAG